MSRWAVFILAAAVGLGLGVGAAWLTREGPPEPRGLDPTPDADLVGEPRPDFEHASLDGRHVRAADFDGRVLLVNFWATWCAPCVREMPLLQEVFEAHDGELHIVGIALDDPGAVRDFAEELGITYPVLVGTGDVMRTNRNWGNTAGALPYTVLVDREGMIRWQHFGEMTEAELEDAVREWL